MNGQTLFLTAVGLAMDAFAVAIATSIYLGHVNHRQVFRLSFHFGLFQAIMPLLGWFAGRTVQSYIQSWDHWAAFALLVVVGAKAIRESLASESDDKRAVMDPTRGLSLISLSVATSIDALAVGLSFAFLRVQIWYAIAVIGVVAAAFTLVGMLLGSRLGERFGRRMGAVGGAVLIAIAVSIVAQHAFGI